MDEVERNQKMKFYGKFMTKKKGVIHQKLITKNHFPIKKLSKYGKMKFSLLITDIEIKNGFIPRFLINFKNHLNAIQKNQGNL